MFDIAKVRSEFPSLSRDIDGRVPLYLDGPGGSQVPRSVAQAVSDYLLTSNSNSGGPFTTSRETDHLVVGSLKAAADFLGASSPKEIVFGSNMTTLTLHLSRAIAKTLSPGDEVIVSRLDHDANVSPWVLAARDAGAVVKKIDVHSAECTLDLEDFERQLSPRTRLVAVTAASNLVGSLTAIRHITRLAHERGAMVYVDAVHAAPHVPIDVQEWDCDFLACSVYKFFGPHVSILYGKKKWLESLPAYKLRPSSDELPWRWMTGTQNHEGLAGAVAAMDYVNRIGMDAVQSRERELVTHLLEELARYPQFKVWGITDPKRLAMRAPTVAITSRDRSPQEMCTSLAAREIYTWAGNLYALELTERLGLEATGGVLRLGLMHYNTHEEIARLMSALVEA